MASSLLVLSQSGKSKYGYRHFYSRYFLGNIPLEEADPAAVMHVMKVILVVFTILCTIGIFISLKRIRV